MDPTILINERVDVAATFKRSGEISSLCMPYRMRYRGQEITFIELGLRHLTSAGKRMIHVFDMSDGTNDYRLEFDAEALTWTLVAMIEGKNAGD
jgi:hypothetical protein